MFMDSYYKYYVSYGLFIILFLTKLSATNEIRNEASN